MDLEQASQQLRERGWSVVPGALAAEQLRAARDALESAIDAMDQRGVSTFSQTLDPNAANIRVYNLPEWSPVFVELLRHPVARTLVEALLGPHTIVSNFTANVALPGSESMKIHSDQALVIPPPWREPWALNIIWCLDDVHEGNGATRYVPDSHRYKSFDEVPADIAGRSLAFEAPAGSLIAMDGRTWHTSGANVSADERRAMLFGYYTKDFIRQQVNWDACLSADTKAGLNGDARAMLGMGPAANTRIGGSLTRLREGEKPTIVVADPAMQSA